MRRRSSSCSCSSRADNCRNDFSVTRSASLVSTISVSSVATARIEFIPSSRLGLSVKRMVRGFLCSCFTRISPRVTASFAPAISVFKNSASGPDTRFCSGDPMNFSRVTSKKFAKLKLEYSTVPSSDRIAAPSSIVSTSTRYGCSAPCSVKTWSPSGLDTSSASTSPIRIARSVSSSSAIRSVSFCDSCARTFPFFRFFIVLLRHREVQTQHHAILIRKVSHQPPQRQRQRFNQRGCRQNLHILGQGGLLINVDDLQLVPAFQIHLAELPKILDRAHRSRRLPRYVQSQRILL